MQSGGFEERRWESQDAGWAAVCDATSFRFNWHLPRANENGNQSGGYSRMGK